MSNYYTLRTKPLFSKPVAKPDLGSSTASYGNLYVANKVLIGNAEVSFTGLVTPKIQTIVYTAGRSTANISGNESLTLTGSNFQNGAVVFIDKREVDTTTFVSSTELTFVTPNKSAGVYSLFVINPGGSTGASSTGITFS